VLVLVIGGGLGSIIRSARDQFAAVKAIKAAGGNVSYEWEWKDGRSIPDGTSWWPRDGNAYALHPNSQRSKLRRTDGCKTWRGGSRFLNYMQVTTSGAICNSAVYSGNDGPVIASPAVTKER